VVIAIIAILAALILPALSRAKSKAGRVKCQAGQKQIALAIRLWMDDNQVEMIPQRVPVPTGIGGGQNGAPPPPNPMADNLWFHYAFLADQLKNPAVVLDPGDKRLNRKMATSFNYVGAPGGRPVVDGDIGAPTYGNNSVSYPFNVDAGATSGSVKFLPYDQIGNHVLMMDYNVSDQGAATGCSSRLGGNLRSFQKPLFTGVAFTNAVHGINQGNACLADGSV